MKYFVRLYLWNILSIGAVLVILTAALPLLLRPGEEVRLMAAMGLHIEYALTLPIKMIDRFAFVC